MIESSEVAQEIARKAMEDVRMKAKMDFLRVIHDRLVRQKQFLDKARSEEFLKGYDLAIAYVKDVLDNPVNWRSV